MYRLGASLPCRYLSFSSLTWIAVFILAFAGAGWGQDRAQVMSAPHPLITKALDESQLTTLKGNTHHLARKEFDLGTAPATLPMQRMLLVLKRSPEQQVALRKLLDDQQDKHSPSYHKWVTPEEFGKRFGPSDPDMQTIADGCRPTAFRWVLPKDERCWSFPGRQARCRRRFTPPFTSTSSMASSTGRMPAIRRFRRRCFRQ
jgi:hypothetical protein